MPSAPPDARAPRRLAPERRRRGDVVVAVALVVLSGRRGARGVGDQPRGRHRQHPRPPRRSRPPARRATCPRASPRRGARRAPPRRAPVVAGPAVVTGDGGTVDGPRRRHRRRRPGATAATSRCARSARGSPAPTTATATPSPSTQSRTGWCSELTALHPSSGKRADASNPDMRPGVQLLADGSLRHRDRPDYLEVWRSDLVRTLEYGDVPTPVQPGKQPRPQLRRTAPRRSAATASA